MRLMQERNVIVPDRFCDRACEYASEGLALVLLSAQGRVEAIFGIGNLIRSDAAEMIKLLRMCGWRVMLASGDDPIVAAGVGRVICLAPSDSVGLCRETLDRR